MTTWYNDSQICDMGCEFSDPDCALHDSTQQLFTLTSIPMQPRAHADWTCPPGFYGSEDGCDTGCGAPDPDCDDNDGVNMTANH